jgi:hypothetical protein
MYRGLLGLMEGNLRVPRENGSQRSALGAAEGLAR